MHGAIAAWRSVYAHPEATEDDQVAYADALIRANQWAEAEGVLDRGLASMLAAREPRRREWLRFSQAWNAIVLTLRRSDLLSDKERDMLLFHTLS
ncbi:MAG: hypothetical protein ACPGNP_12625, partial [Acidimicrobiales bacterium]